MSPISAVRRSPIPEKETLKILVLDDDESIRKITGKMLLSFGHEVHYAENGDDALRQYRELIDCGEPFDLFLFDWEIPDGMSGGDAFMEIFKENPQAKAILASGKSSNLANYKKIGFKAALEKPYTLSELKRAIKTSFEAIN